MTTIGTIFRSPKSETMHFVVTGMETRNGVEYLDGKFVDNENGSIWATIENCVISKDWTKEEAI